MTTPNVTFVRGTFQRALAKHTADLIFTSPPYNIGSHGKRRDGKRKFGEYDPKSFGAITGYADNLPEAEYQDQQAAFMVWAADHLNHGGTLVYNHKPRRKNMAIIHPMQWMLRPEVTERLTLVEEIVWDRGSTHNHDRKQMWQYTERLYVLRRTGEPYALDNFRDRNLPQRSDVWRVSRPTRWENADKHNAPFPVELAEAVVLAWSVPGQTVMDPYAGSGTTGIVSIRNDRNFIGSERVKKYFDKASARINEEIARHEAAETAEVTAA